MYNTNTNDTSILYDWSEYPVLLQHLLHTELCHIMPPNLLSMTHFRNPGSI